MVAIVQRARPWLGTLVRIRVDDADETEATAAIEAAFGAVQAVHQRTSFHEAGSDLSRIHRARVGSVIQVDVQTMAVLRCALQMSNASAGVFDPTIAAQLVQARKLPRPPSPFDPDPAASFRDIELLDATHLRLRRALWIDLGGIAKGYAVDCAMQTLLDAGMSQASVDAGGDLRVAGPQPQTIHLRASDGIGAIEGVQIRDAAVASSATRSSHDAIANDVHIHGIARTPLARDAAVSVVAGSCMIADALTKVVLAADAALTTRVLAAYHAQASTQVAGSGWRVLEAA